VTVREDFRPYLDIRYYWDGRVVSSARRPHFTIMDIAWYLFQLEAEWIPGLLNAGRRNRSLESSQ